MCVRTHTHNSTCLVPTICDNSVALATAGQLTQVTTQHLLFTHTHTHTHHQLQHLNSTSQPNMGTCSNGGVRRINFQHQCAKTKPFMTTKVIFATRLKWPLYTILQKGGGGGGGVGGNDSRWSKQYPKYYPLPSDVATHPPCCYYNTRHLFSQFISVLHRLTAITHG